MQNLEQKMLNEQAATEEEVSDTLPTEEQQAAYFLAEGIAGEGEPPEWYKADKYKSIAEQAKAYTELEKKFGGFKGAPKDGYAAPENIESDDELFVQLKDYAAKYNMSQDAFNSAWDLLSAQNQASQEINTEAELEKLGDNAQQRVQIVNNFLKNNLDASMYEEVSARVVDANSILIIESLVKALAPAKLPKGGEEEPSGITWADIEAEMFKKDDYGNFLRSTDRNHEAKIQKMMSQISQ